MASEADQQGMAGADRQEDEMNFETISLLLSWMELGALLAILFRLGHTFELIANTQRELRRAIHHLGERRSGELGGGWSERGGRTSPSRTASPAPFHRSEVQSSG
jgi:hypothetical protein